MQIVSVDSSAVLKIDYGEDTLFVQFAGGDWYKYVRVPERIWKQFLTAPSKGEFVNKKIKPMYLNVPLTNQELEMVSRIAL